MDEAPEASSLVTKKTWVDELGWYMRVMGFVGLGLGGVCFYFYRNRSLSYPDFNLNANVLGNYLLVAGVASYSLGRVIFYYRRYQRQRRESGLKT